MIEFNEQLIGIGKTITFILISFGLFVALQYAVRWYLFGKYTFRTFNYFEFARKRFRRKSKKPPPDSQDLQVVPPNKKWRISNEVVSLIHSVLSGFWALYSCLMFPKLISNMMFETNPIPRALGTFILLYFYNGVWQILIRSRKHPKSPKTWVDLKAFPPIIMSFGYMIHDLIDLLINERSVRIIELLFHHIVVITGFVVTLITGQFLGVVIFGLLMELNSIFLHCRSLMNLYGQPKNSTAFKFIALLNVATYLVFRIAVCIYLIYWQLTNALNMVWYLAIITFVVIASLTSTNVVLLYRVLTADGIIGKGRQSRAHLPTNSTIGSSIPEERIPDQDDDDLFSSSDYDDDDDTDVEDGKLRAKKSRKLSLDISEDVGAVNIIDEPLQGSAFDDEELAIGVSGRRNSATQTGNGAILKPIILDDKKPTGESEAGKAAKIIIQTGKPEHEKIIVIEEKDEE